MKTLLQILTVLVGLEFFYIMYLETIATTSKKTAQVFKMSQEELSQKNVNVLFKNQGVYNGLLGVLVLLAITVFGKAVLQTVLGMMILIAAYGALTSNPKIILMQGGLPILTLIVSFFA